MNKPFATGNMDVVIQEVDQEESTITVENADGQIATFNVVAPAKINYAKEGKATIGFDKDSNVKYVKMINQYSQKPKGGFKQANITGQPFKKANDYKSDKSYHYESQVRILEGVTLQEFHTVYNELSKSEWIKATQVFQTPIVTTEKKGDQNINHIHYDVIIYLNTKKEGKRDEDEIPDEF